MTGMHESRLKRAKDQRVQRAKARALAKLEAKLVPGADKPVFAYRCAKSGAPFAVAFGKFRGDETYTVLAITTETAETESALQVSPVTHFNTALFEWAGVVCPHCAASGAGVDCSACGETVCNGSKTTQADGTRHFRCQPRCQASGQVEPVKTTPGHNAVRPALPAPPRWPSLPGRTKTALTVRKTQLPAKKQTDENPRR